LSVDEISALYQHPDGQTKASPGTLSFRSFALEQNFPNPFNPSTTVTYTLSAPDHINLTIYNVIGEVVQILVDGYQTAGTFHHSFDAAGRPAGVYFYRLRGSSGRTIMKKMIIMR